VDKREAVRNWNRANWNNIREGIRAETWPTTEDDCTTEEAWRRLREKLDQLIAENVPTVKLRS